MRRGELLAFGHVWRCRVQQLWCGPCGVRCLGTDAARMSSSWRGSPSYVVGVVTFSLLIDYMLLLCVVPILPIYGVQVCVACAGHAFGCSADPCGEICGARVARLGWTPRYWVCCLRRNHLLARNAAQSLPSQ